jgi:capsular polysaccharide biosynthesis protein
VIVSPCSGLIWSKRGVLFGESVGELYRLLGWGACLHEPLIPHKTAHVDAPVVCCPDTLYYHWLLEVLPNILYALDLFPDVKILVSKKCRPFVMEGLELAVGEKAYKQKILFVHDKAPILIPQAVMPALEEWSGFIRPEDVARIRTAFASHLNRNPAPAEQTQLYISRARAYRRRLSHEDGIEELLQNAGFKIIYPEEMSVKDQITVFSQAKTIVAPHGAGLSNMIWRAGDCRIVEIFTPEWRNDCYARLAVQLGFDYDYVSIDEETRAPETSGIF